MMCVWVCLCMSVRVSVCGFLLIATYTMIHVNYYILRVMIITHCHAEHDNMIRSEAMQNMTI